MLDRCPGSREMRAPVPSEKKCPGCGREVEIWSDERKTRCPKCGAAVFGESAPSCADWCKSAGKCLGEMHDTKMKKG